MSALFEAVSARRSHSQVTTDAPAREELLRLVTAAARVADHGALRPWRLLELRGPARTRLGAALAQASGQVGPEADKLAAKALRAPLVIAVVASRKVSDKVPAWEQDAAAAGVAHTLSLLLHGAGWGVMWRTGPYVRSLPVRRMHGLTETEELLGWLYVGGVPPGDKPAKRVAINPADFLTAL